MLTGEPFRSFGAPNIESGLTEEAMRESSGFTKGQRVKTPMGAGSVAYQRMGPPSYSKPVAVSVVLDSKKGKGNYTGTMFDAAKVKPLKESKGVNPEYKRKLGVAKEIARRAKTSEGMHKELRDLRRGDGDPVVIAELERIYHSKLKQESGGSVIDEAKKSKLQVGDIVRYTAKFRRNTGMITGGPINGKVVGFVSMGGGRQFPKVHWSHRDDAVPVAPENVELDPRHRRMRESIAGQIMDALSGRGMERIEEAARAGQFFVIIDKKTGKAVSDIFRGVAGADKELKRRGGEKKAGQQVMDAMWHNPSRAKLKHSGMAEGTLAGQIMDRL